MINTINVCAKKHNAIHGGIYWNVNMNAYVRTRKRNRLCTAWLSLLVFCCAVCLSHAQTTFTWTGGGTTDNFSDTGNWGGENGNTHGIQAFSGTLRLTPFADGTGTLNTHRLYFLEGAGSFVISGRAIGLNDHGKADPSIRNLSANVQTIMNNLIGDSSSDDPLRVQAVNGDIVLMGNITNRGSTLIIDSWGSRERYVALGGEVTGSPSIAIDSGQLRILEGGSINQVGGNIWLGRGDMTTTPAALLIADEDGGTTVSKAINVNAGDGTVNSRLLGASNTGGINTFSGDIVRGSSGNRDITLAQTGGGIVDFDGVISGDHGVIIEGPGTVRFGGENTYAAFTAINSGELHVKEGARIAAADQIIYVGHGATPETPAGLFIADMDGGTTVGQEIRVNPGQDSNRTIGGLNASGQNTFSGNIDMSGSGDRSAALYASDGGTVAFTGEISGGGGITKTGLGVVDLRAANTYTGGTTVAEGILLVNNASGSGTGTGNVTIRSGGALGGGGLITTPLLTVESGGSISPGNSLGTLSIDLGSTGQAVFEKDAYFVFDLTLGGASDQLIFLGTGDILFNDNEIHFINLAGTTLDLGTYTLMIFDEEANVSGELVIGSGLEDYAGSTLSMDNGKLDLNLIPEPSALILLMLGAAALISWRRRGA